MILALLLAASTGPVFSSPHAPRLPIFDGGPLLNVGHGEPIADQNAIIHVTESALFVVGMERLTETRPGMWWSVAGYSAAKILQESCFHTGAGPEVRTDLASSIGAALLVGGIYEGMHALGWIRWGAR